MVKAVWAVLYHSVSTDQEPQHHCCPDGADSWCKYNRALANGQPTPPHNPKLPAELLPFVLPVWSDLCDEELLKKCVLGATQNRNESFNNLVWSRAPKTEFAGKTAVDFAASQAVLVFNSGCRASTSPVLEAIGVQPGPQCLAYLDGKDSVRVKRAKAKASAESKRRRTLKRAAEKTNEEARIEVEGVTYASAEF